MRFDDLAHQGKTQPRATVAAGGGTIQLVEWLEDIIEPVGWDADPGIGHRDNHKILSFTLDGPPRFHPKV